MPLPEAAGPSMAMIMAGSVRIGGAELPHQRDEGREARLDHGAVVDGHRVAGGEPHDEERHGDAVVEMGRDRAAARDRAAEPVHDEIVALDRVGTPACASPPATAARRSDSFTRSSCRPSHPGRPFGEGRRDGEDGYSSIIAARAPPARRRP